MREDPSNQVAALDLFHPLVSALTADVDEGESGRFDSQRGLEEYGFIVATAAAEDVLGSLQSRVSVHSRENTIKLCPAMRLGCLIE